MNDLFCKHQETMVDDSSGVALSACRNPDASHFHDIVSELICQACRLRKEPSAEDQLLCKNMQEHKGGDTLEKRSLAARKVVLDTYCLKCNHCDAVDRVCNVCRCNVRLPVDDYVKYTAHHCPLELW